jgi:hypothetical protein
MVLSRHAFTSDKTTSKQKPMSQCCLDASLSIWASSIRLDPLLRNGCQLFSTVNCSPTGRFELKSGPVFSTCTGVSIIISSRSLMQACRADSKSLHGFSSGCRRAFPRSAVMSCITACRPSRMELNPANRSRFNAVVRSVAITPAPLPRYR